MRSVVRLLFTVAMDVLLVVAALLVVRIVVGFFGRLGATQWATQVMDLTAPLAPSLGLDTIVTPYRGVFDVSAGVVLAIVFAVEWVLSLLRRLAR